MIDYQEFCDRFWIAANRETERMFAKSETGSKSAFSDGLSFARSLTIVVHFFQHYISILMANVQVEMADEQDSAAFDPGLQ